MTNMATAQSKNQSNKQQRASFEIQDGKIQQRVFGPGDENLKLIAKRLDVSFWDSDAELTFKGYNCQLAVDIIKSLVNKAEAGAEITLEDVEDAIAGKEIARKHDNDNAPSLIKTPKKKIKPRTYLQSEFMKAMQNSEVTFGLGPAGSGKTYLAVAQAVQALVEGDVKRIILTRPAVEAGEKLGFLPGDLSQKIDPYLRPLYDALHETLGPDETRQHIERNIIEVAPLAYMRGRTLNNAFVILDEAQNTSVEQMKMFLTRLGYGSKMIVNGDTSQIDLPKGTQSGLKYISEALKDVVNIPQIHFTSEDVVRHPMVKAIVSACETHDGQSQDNPSPVA